MNVCAYCGISFDGRKKKYCSDKCRYEADKENKRMTYVGKREDKCVICGKPLPKFKTRYCSAGCRRQAEIAKRGKGEAHGLLVKTCIVCGKNFSTYKSRQNTCSPACAKKHSYQLGKKRAYIRYHEAGGRTREEIHEEAIKNRAAREAERKERRQKYDAWLADMRAKRAEREALKRANNWLNRGEKRVCECCGKTYIAHHPLQRYCSDKCGKYIARQKDHKKRKYADIMVDPDITLRKLARRDKNVCQICGLMVDWSDKTKAKGTVICGPMYPSVDHIYPVSRGGKHAWNNVQLAHRKCNNWKSDSIA